MRGLMGRAVRSVRAAPVVKAAPARTRTDLGPHDVARLNLEVVADALEAAGVPYLVLRVPGVRHRVVVREPSRRAALAAVAGCPEAASMRARLLGTDGARAVPAADLTDPDGYGVRLFRRVAASAELAFGADCGCDLEFWSVAGDGALRAPCGTPIGRDVPAAAQVPAALPVGDRRYPSLEAFVRPRSDEVGFAVDAVYTWVDGADPAWLSRRAAALGERRPHRADGGPARYLSRDELRYSLRSLAMFAPWIGRVWIVTDAQVPAWLDTAHPRVRVVDHRDVFTDPSALPTYNSHAIETRLHHIDGLAEHFLYLNDDFFLGRPLRPERFFTPAGVARCFPSPTTIPPGPVAEGDPTWIAAAKNARALVESEFGSTTTCAFKHAPYALRRSVLADLEARFPAAFAATAASRVRSRHDIAPVSSLYQHHGRRTGAAVDGSLSCDTIPLGRADALPTLERLLTARDRDAFCLNDLATGDLTEDEKTAAVASFLPRYFPIPAPWERGSHPT
ncbi:stealth family protein [Actinomadura flavalba]|uniref:stealth family protein n=1 Tax=Actinomadura flavalba TaxID=1120938 RepID=UPI00146D1427|nr:stealth family protein [Actinomadura flavalba]